MSTRLLNTAAILLFAIPAVAFADSQNPATGTCPSLDKVLATVTPKSDWLDSQKLIAETGAAAHDQYALNALAGQIAAHAPQVSDANVANILIASYCEYLQTAAPGTNDAASLSNFETLVYNSVVPAPTNDQTATPQEKQGWLYSDQANQGATTAQDQSGN